MGKIDLGEFALYPLSMTNEEDKRFLKDIKDKEARKYHLKDIIRNDLKRKTAVGNSYLIKKDEVNVGYACVSDINRLGDRNITLAIHKDFRNNHIGSRFIETLSGYTLEMNLAKGITAYIDKQNEASQKVFIHSGFIHVGNLPGPAKTEIYRKR